MKTTSDENSKIEWNPLAWRGLGVSTEAILACCSCGINKKGLGDRGLKVKENGEIIRISEEVVYVTGN